ncbi:uncharacterized protein [Nicotiana sylvestris]|uniref:uncharacterized protein n=1 Tax=Nicotiana sylvestris TaxID=4096 RepID=UPI00388C4751
MEEVNLLVNKRRQRSQQMQSNQDQYEHSGSGYNQDDSYDDQSEEVLYANNYQGQQVDEKVSEENLNDEVRIDIPDNKEETQNDVNPSREHVINIPKTVMPKAKAPLPRPPPPYPQRLEKQKNENQFKKFIEMMKNLSINVPLVEAL